MKALLLLLCACAFAQTIAPPPATFTGTVKEMTSTTLTLARPDQEYIDIWLTHKTHYLDGSRKIKRHNIKAGDRVSVDTTLNLYLKPEAVTVRLQPPPKE